MQDDRVRGAPVIVAAILAGQCVVIVLLGSTPSPDRPAHVGTPHMLSNARPPDQAGLSPIRLARLKRSDMHQGPAVYNR